MFHVFIFYQDMFHPLDDYRNPCWYEILTGPNPNENHMEYCKYPGTKPLCQKLSEIYRAKWEEGERTRLRCLPYFYFVGVTKAGTTDLKYQLGKHPDIVDPLLSEINWWNRRRQGNLL